MFNHNSIFRRQPVSMERIDVMSGIAFEKYVAILLRHYGFTDIHFTEKYDMGVDITAYKNGTHWGIQIKRYSGLVKAAAVRQVVAGLTSYMCERSIVITNSYFSRPACILAAANDCILIDRDKLEELLDY